MRKKAGEKSFLTVLLLLPVMAFPLHWPVEKPALCATFGESRGDYYHTGIDIGGGEQEVYSVADGEVIYYQQENNRLSSLPSGLGNFVVIEHDRQLRTMYAHLKAGSIDTSGENVSAGDIIGRTSDSGASKGVHLHFEVIDRELNEFVNPLILLPAMGDRTKPVIRDVFIKISTDSEYTNLPGRSNIVSGKYDIAAEIYDVSEHVNYLCQVAPYKVNLYINGEMTSSMVYNSIKKSGNYLAPVNNPVYVRDLYIDKSNWKIHLGQFDFKPGTIRLEIEAADFAGNQSSKELILYSATR